MGVKIAGAYENLYTTRSKAVVVLDKWVPDDVIWITTVPLINPHNNPRIIFRELKIICAPKNRNYAQVVADMHNEIVNSPLSKVMSEEE